MRDDGHSEGVTSRCAGRYRREYYKLFSVIEQNAPQTETRVGAEVVASGIVRASDERVQVLVFVDRPTTNKLDAEPTVYKDQVTLSMQLVDGVWLVDDMVTSSVQGGKPARSGGASCLTRRGLRFIIIATRVDDLLRIRPRV